MNTEKFNTALAEHRAVMAKRWLSCPTETDHDWRCYPDGTGLIDYCEKCGEERA